MNDAAFLELVKNSRSYRRFNEGERIEKETLLDLINLARLSPSGANLQPLRFIFSNEPVLNQKIFETLEWAGYLKDWDGPRAGERPSAYIVICNDITIRKNPGCDHGIAAQSIMLGAAALGLGGCMVGSIHREPLRKILSIDEKFKIMLVLALGRPRETVMLEEMPQDGDIKYYRDAKDVHHVPKRKLEDIVLN